MHARNQGGTAERNERFVPEWTERFCVSSDVQVRADTPEIGPTRFQTPYPGNTFLTEMPAVCYDLPSFTKELIKRIDALSKEVVGLSLCSDHVTGDFGP